VNPNDLVKNTVLALNFQKICSQKIVSSLYSTLVGVINVQRDQPLAVHVREWPK